MKLHLTCLIFAGILLPTFLQAAATAAAPANDHCTKATKLADVTNWCSASAQFTTAGATASGVDNPVCFPPYVSEPDNDVWFQFVSVATALNISVIGAIDNNPKGSLQYPQLVVYKGTCKEGLQEIACISDSRGFNIVETFVSNLAVGGTYYIRVDARNGKTGTFQLCVNNFSPVPSPSSDCSSAVVLCDKSPFTVPVVQGAGKNRSELTGGICLPEESSSAWYKWTCNKGGTLTFTLRPVNPADDLDFALFLLPNGVENCSVKIPVRCMASGENVGQPYRLWAKCTGSTGLRTTASDVVEDQGCAEEKDNFLAPLNMESGRSYALMVNNYHNTGNGFSIEFGGSATFVGPVAHFTVSKLKIEKEKELVIKDASSFGGGISKWEWNFGVGAKPQSAVGKGPHKVTFNSAGKKSISLSIQTGNGCKVTKVRNIEVTAVPPPPPPPPPPAPKGESATAKKQETKPVSPAEKKPEAPSPKPETSPVQPVALPPQTPPELIVEKGGQPPLEEKTPPENAPETSGTPPPQQQDTVRKMVEFSVKYVANIYFRADSASLMEKDFETLAEILRLLQENPQHLAIVEGHTNSIPSDEYCNKLAAERADTIIAWLTGKGVDSQRITRKVFGKNKPGKPDPKGVNRKWNQRVEVKIIKREN
ncbi:MAG: OmpA family protein [Bacteroidota bacterium]